MAGKAFASLSFGDQFLKLSSDTSLVSTVKDTTDAEINSLLDIKIQYEVPHIQSPSVLTLHVLVIFESSVLTPLGVAKLEKDVSEMKIIDHSTEALATLKSQVPTPALESSKIQKPTIDLEQESEKSASEIRKIKREHAEKKKMPKYTIKSTDKATPKEYDLKSALYQTMHNNKSFNRNPANHTLYHALMEALIEDENAMDKGAADTETPKGKAPSKGSKSVAAKESVEEPIAEVVMDDTVNIAGEDMPWFNQMVSASKDPLTFNDLMATPIDFSKYVSNRLKIDNLTQDLLLGHAINLLKGTCTSSIELEYNFQECFNALTDKLD
ncbi:hypothetical protein Tco_0904774 [Tanacetum coccineum]